MIGACGLDQLGTGGPVLIDGTSDAYYSDQRAARATTTGVACRCRLGPPRGAFIVNFAKKACNNVFSL